MQHTLLQASSNKEAKYSEEEEDRNAIVYRLCDILHMDMAAK